MYKYVAYSYRFFHTHRINYFIYQFFRHFSNDLLLESNGISKRYLALCSPGIETYLSKEFKNITKQNPIRMDKGSIEFILPNELVWDYLLNTRFCRSLWVYLMEPFHVTHEKEFIRKVSRAEWNHLIKFDINSNTPNIKVKCSNSRLSHTKMISRSIKEIVNMYKMNVLNTESDKTEPDSPEPSEALDLDISIINNTCKILANVSGPLDSRFYLSKGEKMPILPTVSSAVLSHIIDTNHGDLSHTTIWDPFCNNGIVLLELYSLLSGIPVGSPNIDYPLKKMPYNEEYEMNKAVNKMSIEPLDVGEGISLLGSDMSTENIAIAKQNMANFDELCPKTHVLGRKSAFEIKFESFEVEEYLSNLEKGMIITNFLYGSKDSEETIAKAYKRLLEIIKLKNDWINIYIISGRASFHRYTKLNWHKEMNFNNQGIKCELLRLAK